MQRRPCWSTTESICPPPRAIVFTPERPVPAAPARRTSRACSVDRDPAALLHADGRLVLPAVHRDVELEVHPSAPHGESDVSVAGASPRAPPRLQFRYR